MHDVEVSSYVDVRVMDLTGDIPLPAEGALPVALVATSITQPVSGTVAINGFTSTTPIPVEGHVIVDNSSINVNVLSTVAVAGSVSVSNLLNPMPVSVSNFPNPMHVSVDNTVGVSGTVSAQTALYDPFSGAWNRAIGLGGQNITLTSHGAVFTSTNPGVAPIAISSGIDGLEDATVGLVNFAGVGTTPSNYGIWVKQNPSLDEELDS